MQTYRSWTVEAVNFSKRSENPIHDDRIAQRHGFRAGLVPGATVFAYLVHPALCRWGESWLDRGRAAIVLSRPFYDQEPVVVTPQADGANAYACELRGVGGEVRAKGAASLPDPPAESPVPRDDPPAPDPNERPWATRETFERLREQGMGSIRSSWRAEPPYDRYTKELDDMPAHVRPDQRAFANAAFVLNLANLALSSNVRLGPWIHVESEVQNHGRLPLGRSVHVESSVVEVLERSGHEFCDLQVHAFLKEGAPIASVRHRVIYRLREPHESRA